MPILAAYCSNTTTEIIKLPCRVQCSYSQYIAATEKVADDPARPFIVDLGGWSAINLVHCASLCARNCPTELAGRVATVKSQVRGHRGVHRGQDNRIAIHFTVGELLPVLFDGIVSGAAPCNRHPRPDDVLNSEQHFFFKTGCARQPDQLRWFTGTLCLFHSTLDRGGPRCTRVVADFRCAHAVVTIWGADTQQPQPHAVNGVKAFSGHDAQA